MAGWRRPCLPTTSSARVSGDGYEEAWLACRLIAEGAGAAGLVRMYRLVGACPDPRAAAVAAARRHVLRLSRVAFTAHGRDYLTGHRG